METLHFQRQESQQEGAIPFRGKAHLLKEGQTSMGHLQERTFLAMVILPHALTPRRVCEPCLLIWQA